MKKLIKLITILVIVSSFVSVLTISYGLKPSGNDVQQYDFKFSTSHLGNYSIIITAHEIPSHEILPLTVVGKEYFPHSTVGIDGEVDNTPPSALYHARNVVKVDVVFALGDTSQSEALQNNIANFTTILNRAGNYIDANVEQVKTSTIDMSEFGAREIFNQWRKMPASNGRGKEIWELNEEGGTIYAEGIRKKGSQTFHHRSTAIINDSEEAFKTGDLEFEFSYNALGSNGETNYHNVMNGWSNHQAGLLFRYTEDENGNWYSYALMIGDANGTSYRGNLTGKCGLSLVKVYRGDKDWLPGTYGGNLFISWHTGVKDTSGKLTNPYAGWEGDYPIGVWRAGEGSTLQRVCAMQARAVIDTDSHDFKVVVKGNNIKVYCGDKLELDVDDTFGTPGNPNGESYDFGTYGFFSLSSPNVHFGHVKITAGERKSLGEAIQDVAWRDGATRIVIHAADTVPDDFADPESGEFIYTLSKLLSANSYLINLGLPNGWAYDEEVGGMVPTGNKKELERMGELLTLACGEQRSVYFDSRSPDIIASMNSAEAWIEELLHKWSRPVDWILVGDQVQWSTSYTDTEWDLPLNFGENTDDTNLLPSWGLGGLTHYYKDDKILAERWRYRHLPEYFDNSLVQEPYHDVWIEDPVEYFYNPGRFRINYKRRDNPLYTDTTMSNIFNNYRYWSTDYDYRKTGENIK